MTTETQIIRTDTQETVVICDHQEALRIVAEMEKVNPGAVKVKEEGDKILVCQTGDALSLQEALDNRGEWTKSDSKED